MISQRELETCFERERIQQRTMAGLRSRLDAGEAVELGCLQIEEGGSAAPEDFEAIDNGGAIIFLRAGGCS